MDDNQDCAESAGEGDLDDTAFLVAEGLAVEGNDGEPSTTRLQRQVQSFVTFFRNQVTLVGSLAGDAAIRTGASEPAHRVAIHKKILFSAILDALAGIRYRGEKLKNHDRFVQFLREHTDWCCGSLVSVQILRDRLHRVDTLQKETKKVPETADPPASDNSGTGGEAASAPPTALVCHLESRISSRASHVGGTLAIRDLDEPIFTIEQLANAAERALVDKCLHFELLYSYRNFIVHEFREPGQAMEEFADEGVEPLYHGYCNSPGWHLLYPVGFFAARAAAAVDSLNQWLLANNVDPYARIRDSLDWDSGNRERPEDRAG